MKIGSWHVIGVVTFVLFLCGTTAGLCAEQLDPSDPAYVEERWDNPADPAVSVDAGPEEAVVSDSAVTEHQMVAEETPEEPRGYEGSPDESIGPYDAGDRETPEPVGEEAMKLSDRFYLIAEVDLFLSMSDIEGEDGGQPIGGLDARALLAPSVQVTDNIFVTLMYDGKYHRKRELYSDDVGTRRRNEYMAHTVTGMVPIYFGEEGVWSVTPSVFHTWTFNRDSEDTTFDEGLYNYRDIGGGVDVAYRDLGFAGGEGKITVGGQVYGRTYPNYTSLLDLAIGLDTEEDEKDYTGLILRGEYEWAQKGGFSWSVGYTYFQKWLTDKKVVGSDGVLTDEKQTDFSHTFTGKVVYNTSFGLILGLEGHLGWYFSNQGFYDGMGSIGLLDDVFIESYYDHVWYRIRPHFAYRFQDFPVIISGSYGFKRLSYLDRNSKHSNGLYMGDNQWEDEHEFVLGVRYEINEMFSLVAQWQHIIGYSNNEDERIYLYDYALNNFAVGVTFRY